MNRKSRGVREVWVGLIALVAACQASPDGASRGLGAGGMQHGATIDSASAVALADSQLTANGDGSLRLHCMTRVTGGYFMTYITPVLDTTVTVTDGVRFVTVTDDGKVHKS